MFFYQKKLRVFIICTALILLLFPVFSRAEPPALTPQLSLLLSDKGRLTLLKSSSFTDPLDKIFSILFSPIVFDGLLWFSTADQEHGVELWRTDGTEEGTICAVDINPGPLSSFPVAPVIYKNALYFFANDSANGRELRRTAFDVGTGQYKTTLVKNIFPGADDAVEDFPPKPVILNSRLVFAADNGIHGEELWMSDGTEQGTMRVSDINPGAADAKPNNLTVLPKPGSLGGDILVFSARSDALGKELYRLSRLFFTHNYKTSLIQDIKPANGSSSPSSLDHSAAFTPYSGSLYFRAANGMDGEELWRTDGTTAGTSMVKDIEPGTGNGISSLGNALVFRQELYFSGHDDNTPGLWKTDGTAAGTIRAFSSGPQLPAMPLFIFNNALYFTAYQVASNNKLTGTLWKRSWDDTSLNWLDLPLGNTVPFLQYGFVFEGFDSNTPELNSRLYFVGGPPTDNYGDYWVYSLNDKDTIRRIREPHVSGSAPYNLIKYHEALFFSFFVDEGAYLYRFDPEK